MQYPEYIPYRPQKRRWLAVLVCMIAAGMVAGLVLIQIPRFRRALAWRMDIAVTYIRSALNPVGDLPTPAVNVMPELAVTTATPAEPTATAAPTSTPIYTPTPTLVPTPIPAAVQLDSLEYNEGRDQQDPNNCGPATLALYLRYYGWEGDQTDISDVIKPTMDDKNVNVDELQYYVRNYAGWLDAEFRVGGDLEILKKLIAAGVPVMIEETFITDRPYRIGDDQWAGHYLLITGYDDNQQMFTVHDTEVGPDQHVPYAEIEEKWQSFNYVYLMAYPPEKEGEVQSVLGEDWDVDTNRQNALDLAQEQTIENPDDPFAWFNLGTNLVYFERYNEAAAAYDKARTRSKELPQRMLRYQFGPFIAYFHSLQTEELMALVNYALSITPTSEEALLWKGWGYYRQGENDKALKLFRDALHVNAGFQNAKDAVEFLGGS